MNEDTMRHLGYRVRAEGAGLTVVTMVLVTMVLVSMVLVSIERVGKSSSQPCCSQLSPESVLLRHKHEAADVLGRVLGSGFFACGLG